MSKLKKLYPAFIAVSSVLPLATLAQGTPGEIDNRIRQVSSTLELVITILFVLATVIFLWGVIQFIANSGSEEGRKKAKGIMTWGIIGLAVMAAAWGLARVLVNYFGAGGGSPGFVNPPRTSLNIPFS